MPAREGSLEAPIRHSLDWTQPKFYDEEDLFMELERVFDICHGCRRCVSLCQSFPELFDLVDESSTMEVDGVVKADYWKVVDHCYLCDLCFMTKCPYVPPHEWNLDFPHLMLRAKAVKFKQGKTKARDRILSSTDAVGALASLPGVVNLVNATNRSDLGRKAMEVVLGVHPDARIPEYHNNTLRKQLVSKVGRQVSGEEVGSTTGKVALFTTCYNNVNEPDVGMDLVTVFEHNGIPITIPNKERCCGMPKLELGDLDSVQAHMEENIPVLMNLVDEGWDIVAPIPSCVLMFKQELPLMFPNDPRVQQIRQHIYDPFEYLMIRHKHGKLRTDFNKPLGTVAYHAACHQRVQNLGQKTRELLSLIPDTKIDIIERCSGHDGTYAVKQEFHAYSMKILAPVVNRVKQIKPDHYGSDCPMAGQHIGHGLKDGTGPKHPLTLLRLAYGL
jgi:glycerol-3-phosphate dehydrogenase subunit C